VGTSDQQGTMTKDLEILKSQLRAIIGEVLRRLPDEPRVQATVSPDGLLIKAWPIPTDVDIDLEGAANDGGGVYLTDEATYEALSRFETEENVRRVAIYRLPLRLCQQ
jgi:hypothetical protein